MEEAHIHHKFNGIAKVEYSDNANIEVQPYMYNINHVPSGRLKAIPLWKLPANRQHLWIVKNHDN